VVVTIGRQRLRRISGILQTLQPLAPELGWGHCWKPIHRRFRDHRSHCVQAGIAAVGPRLRRSLGGRVPESGSDVDRSDRRAHAGLIKRAPARWAIGVTGCLEPHVGIATGAPQIAADAAALPKLAEWGRIDRAHRDLRCIWRARAIGSPTFKSSFFLTLGPPKLSGCSSEQPTKMTG
jgi:hypothetical protein